MPTPADLLAQSLAKLQTANRVDGNRNSYRKDMPGEYTLVTGYLKGAARPAGVTSDMGLGLMLAEDARRALNVTPPDPVPPDPPVTATKYASPNGSDSNPGTLAAPFKTPSKLSASLKPGETGMLRGGTYGQFLGWDNSTGMSANGTASQRITITNYPGEHVLLRGAMGVGGSFITLRNLHFDTTNDQRPDHGCGVSAFPYECDATDLIFEYNEIFQSGNPAYPSNLKNSGIYQATGDRNIYRYNIIRDVGGCQALDHGIYLGHGNGCEVYGNWIYNDAHGWGIQVYPECKNGKFHSNVIDNCGSGFVICDDAAGGTAGNDVYNNVISNCIADNADKQFGDYAKSSGAGLSGMGTNAQSNNKFRDNVVWNCPAGIAGETEPYWGVHPPPSNITITGNVKADPLFVDAANHNYLLKSGSPAASYGLPTTKPGPTV